MLPASGLSIPCHRSTHEKWTLIGAARDLAHRLGDMPHAVHTALAETPAKGIDRQFAFERDASVLYEIAALALLAEARRLEPVERRRVEAIVKLGSVHVLRTKPGGRP